MTGSDANTGPRGWFALAALLVFLITLGWGFSLAGTKRWADAREVLTLALPIEAALLCAAGRYYFAGSGRRLNSRSETRKG